MNLFSKTGFNGLPSKSKNTARIFSISFAFRPFKLVWLTVTNIPAPFWFRFVKVLAWLFKVPWSMLTKRLLARLWLSSKVWNVNFPWGSRVLRKRLEMVRSGWIICIITVPCAWGAWPDRLYCDGNSHVTHQHCPRSSRRGFLFELLTFVELLVVCDPITDHFFVKNWCPARCLQRFREIALLYPSS